MQQRDASFTFLHRIEEVEQNVEDGRWQSALALALTLPDICGGIAFPDVVKRYRDGRVMLDRQKNPTRDVGNQYIRWFDEYASEYFKLSKKDSAPYICGKRCWQLRCEYLHQNKGFSNDENEDDIRFHLGVNCGTSLCQMEQPSMQEGSKDIRIDIKQFCLRMCHAARNYYNMAYREKDFGLYNTPVLDFIQTEQEIIEGKAVVILCEQTAYANGLKLALKKVAKHILVFSSMEDARKKLKRQKPAVWIVTEKIGELEEQAGPVIRLAHFPNQDALIYTRDGNRTTLAMPVEPEVLRDAVKIYLG